MSTQQQARLILTALAYAHFDNTDIEDATKELISGLGDDLDEAGYESSIRVDELEEKLTEALNDSDEQNEDVKEAFVAGAGLSEEDDDEDEVD